MVCKSIIGATCACLFATQAYASLLKNGSLNYPTPIPVNPLFNGYAPTDWEAANGVDGDVFDPVVSSQGGGSWVPSNDGGTFFHGIAAKAALTPEGIFQTVTGLVVGQKYKLTFEQSSGNYSGLTDNATGYWKIGWDNKLSASSAPMPSINLNYWQQQSFILTATTTETQLSFVASVEENFKRVDLGLDGISLTAVHPRSSLALRFWSYRFNRNG